MKKNERVQRFMNKKSLLLILRKMKLTILLVCLGILNSLGSVYSQNSNLSLNFKNSSLKEVLSEIENKTNFSFLYKADVIDHNQAVNVHTSNASVTEVLDLLAEQVNFGYEIMDNSIIVLTSLNPAQQQTAVSGRVTDHSGAPLPGVTVALKGTSQGTITNLNGSYQLPNIPHDGTLVFSFVGMKTQEFPVKGKATINVLMEEKSIGIEEVVAIGYGSMRKSDLTGSVSSVSSKDIAKQTVSNLGEALQGRVAGLNIVSSGQPGNIISMKIRGLGTTNNSNPLIVIDGVPTEISLNILNTDDIATVDVLKDASATAIYGSRGANGVVLITTKKGKAGEQSLSVKASYTLQEAINMPKLLNAGQFAALHNEMMINNAQTQNPAFSDPAALGKGTDWLGALFQTSPIQNYSLSYSGGNQKTTYYVSGGVMDQQGIVINTGYRRYTVQFNSESRIFDWLSFGNKLTLNHENTNYGSYDVRETMAALPTQPIFDENGDYSGPVGRSMWDGDIRNPIGRATLNEQKIKGYNVIGNIYAEVTLLKDLKFKTLAGIEAREWDTRQWNPQYDWKPIAQPQSYLFRQYNKSMTYLWDNHFTYNKDFSNQHITVMAGTSAQNNVYDYMNGSIQGFISESAQQINNGTLNQTIKGSGQEWSLLSMMARVNYSYANKYLLTATVRRDGSSRFGESNRWGTFPSFSVAWRLSEERFFKKTDLLNDIKFRFGYGITGNQNIGNYSFASVFNTDRYVFNGETVPSLVPLKMPNPKVKWEEVGQTNIGVDLTLFKQRVQLNLDGYIKNTNDMLVPMSVPISTGYSDIYVPSINAGQVRNRGLELTLTSQNIQGEFEWSTTLSASYNKNKILDLNGDVPMYQNTINMSYVTIQAVGHPVNSFYGFVTNGIFQTPEEVENYAVQVSGDDPYNRTSPGDIRFKDLDRNGIINDNDRTYIGNPTPEWTFAMNNMFRWKGFDLEVFIQGIAGNEIFNANRIWQEGMAVAQNQTTAVLDRWTGEGSSNSMPRAVFNDPNHNTRISNRFIEDGSYVRLKNISLGYTLPQSWVKKNNVRLFVSCQNVFTLSDYSGFDPEVSVGNTQTYYDPMDPIQESDINTENGIDNSLYPLTRTFSMGVHINF